MRARARTATLSRKTKETEIKLKINLDGKGTCDCKIDNEFLRHMMETLARYSGADIEISAQGDIAHHLIEDVAITLGKGFRQAIGDRPIKRIACATVPMDEALVQVSIDLIDRPYVHVEIPDQIYEHFLRSFAMELKATIHSIVLRGKDEHHITEATFKALGLALWEAKAPIADFLSTKSRVQWRTD